MKLWDKRNVLKVDGVEIMPRDYRALKQYYEIANELLEKMKEENETLREHNLILFNTIKNQIEQFESEPLSEDGMHRITVNNDTLLKLKETLINVGYSFD